MEEKKKFPNKILVVEDNLDHQLLIRNAFARWTETAVQLELVPTVEEALHQLASNVFDLILTDYCLPDKTGLDLLAEMKARNLKFPILLMTGMGDEILAVNALKSGFIDYVVKSEDTFHDIPRIVQGAYLKYQAEERERQLKEELAHKNIELRSTNQKLAELSAKDELTSLYNHRFFQEKMVEEFARATRYHFPLSCLMVDIDHFKVVNDTHGHLTGDEVLRQLGHFFSSHLRQADTVARYGGEEFVILLPHVGYEGAQILAERLRKKIMDQSFGGNSSPLKISISIGVSSYPEDPVDRKETLIFYADKALYRAKGGGRNRVALYKSMSKEYVSKVPELKFNQEKVRQFHQRLFDVSEMAKRAYIEATKALINALEAKDPHTMGHAARVSQYSALIAREMGLGEDDIRIIEHAGLLHDIGKICIPDEILLKPGAYTPEEYEQMKSHSKLGYQIVKTIKFLSEEASIILHHHEWYNGQGYPNRLKGKEIPLGARVVSVSDAYDTMRAAGSRYKRTLNCEEAVRELITHSSTQFDPEPVFHFVQVLLKRGDLQPHAYDRQKLDQSIKSIAA